MAGHQQYTEHSRANDQSAIDSSLRKYGRNEPQQLHYLSNRAGQPEPTDPVNELEMKHRTKTIERQLSVYRRGPLSVYYDPDLDCGSTAASSLTVNFPPLGFFPGGRRESRVLLMLFLRPGSSQSPPVVPPPESASSANNGHPLCACWRELPRRSRSCSVEAAVGFGSRSIVAREPSIVAHPRRLHCPEHYWQ